jgi:SulP family sulfate permease
MLLILLAFSGVIAAIAQPTLAGLLIVAGIGSIRPQYIASILRTSAISRVAFGATLIATPCFPWRLRLGRAAFVNPAAQ